MNEAFVETWGYIGLFVVTFLSSSVVPLTSEVLLILMQRMGYNVWWVLGVATVGNYCGSLTTYGIGRFGGSRLLEKYVHPKPERMARARQLYARYGGPILFFSFIPIIGDALTFVAGVLQGNLWTFTFWVALGKWVRFAVVLGLAGWLLDIFLA